MRLAPRAVGMIAVLAWALGWLTTSPPALAAQPSTTVLEVRTVPPLSGMKFTLDGRMFATRRGGVARITYRGESPLRDRLQGVETVTRPGVRASLARWYGDLDRPRQGRLIAALNVDYAIDFSFENLHGKPIDPARIQFLSVRSSHGVVTEVQKESMRGPHWLQGVRVVSTPHGPLAKDLLQSIERVRVDGTNVVNRAQQRFFPRKQRRFGITLLLYSARFESRDALFGFPIGSGVRLRHPDGRWTYHPFTSSGQLVVGELARGEYWVEVKAPGLSFLRPVTLSRNQQVPLEVLSYVDIGLTVAILVATALGLLYIGRPHLFTFLGVLHPKRRPGRRLAGRA